jgi:hypothetical protein
MMHFTDALIGCTGGEGGSGSQGDTPEPILLTLGTTVKEVLLIIHYRPDAKGDFDSLFVFRVFAHSDRFNYGSLNVK